MPSFFQIGKDGVTPTVNETIMKALRTNELIKINVLKTCETPVRQVALDVSSATKTEVVQIIGKTIVLYKRHKEPKIILPK